MDGELASLVGERGRRHRDEAETEQHLAGADIADPPAGARPSPRPSSRWPRRRESCRRGRSVTQRRLVAAALDGGRRRARRRRLRGRRGARRSCRRRGPDPRRPHPRHQRLRGEVVSLRPRVGGPGALEVGPGPPHLLLTSDQREVLVELVALEPGRNEERRRVGNRFR